MSEQKYNKRKSNKKPQTLAQEMCQFIIKSLGIGLIVFLYLLVAVIFHTLSFDIAYIYYTQNEENTELIACILGFGTICTFCILFNFTMAVFVDPGNNQNLGDKQGYPEIDTLSDQEIKSLEDQGKIKMCRKCDKIKPKRAHHCSICNVCILKMDHHCPWINNCVGHQNQRYFLLFLLWIVIGTGYVSALCLNIHYNQELYDIKIKHRSMMFSLVQTLVYALFVILLFFAGWNWYLACSGQTTIEFWKNRSQDQYESGELEIYSYGDIKANFWTIFGTKNYFLAILPSIRELPLKGYDWNNITTTSNNSYDYKSIIQKEIEDIENQI